MKQMMFKNGFDSHYSRMCVEYLTTIIHTAWFDSIDRWSQSATELNRNRMVAMMMASRRFKVKVSLWERAGNDDICKTIESKQMFCTLFSWQTNKQTHTSTKRKRNGLFSYLSYDLFNSIVWKQKLCTEI